MSNNQNEKSFCIYNAIKTPDGTILHCTHEHDYKTHLDKISNETYMNDGALFYVRRSVNKIKAEDLSVWSNDPHEKVRLVKFWGSLGKDGKGPKKFLCLAEMEESHIKAILDTQKQIKNFLDKLFINELKYRKLNLINEIVESSHSTNENIKQKHKI